VCKVLRTIHTENKPDEVRGHHQQDIEDTANGTNMTIPPPLPKLQRNKERY
jgi:hypothetical protein